MMEARAEIKEILDELRKEKSEKIARRAYSRLAKLEDGFRGEIDKVSDKNHYLEIDWDKVVIGDVVMLKTLHQKVTIVSLPDKNKRLFVDMGTMKMKVKKGSTQNTFSYRVQTELAKTIDEIVEQDNTDINCGNVLEKTNSIIRCRKS